MAADTGALIERLGIGPCPVVGFSLGALITQELLVTRGDLVTRCVLMATRGRTDAMRSAMCPADRLLDATGSPIPAEYRAVVRALFNLSRRTLNDDEAAREWLDRFELADAAVDGYRAQLGLDHIPDRLAALRGVRVPTMVLTFEDDLIAPPHLGREVAEAIPGAVYEQVKACGHYGYLEEPETVNAALLRFLR
jgi:pimeloyl-ACP methyl ester carboxylesterase